MSEPTNEERSARIDAVMDMYAKSSGSDDDSILTDFLTDLRHWAEREGLDFDRANGMAEIHYECEKEGCP